MSNYLGIAAVTAALQDIVQSAVQDVVPGVTIRIGPPRAILPGATEVNLYLYQVTANAQLRNADLPQWAGDALVRQPQAAIDLHYLIAFAGEDHLATEVMLGKVVSVLHARPRLSRDLLRRLARPGGAFPMLAGSNLADQHDQVEFVAQYLTFEDLSKLWTVFFQIAHRPSLQYIASPVMIDGQLPIALPQPRRRLTIG
jgi:hypothetical protein